MSCQTILFISLCPPPVKRNILINLQMVCRRGNIGVFPFTTNTVYMSVHASETFVLFHSALSFVVAATLEHGKTSSLLPPSLTHAEKEVFERTVQKCLQCVRAVELKHLELVVQHQSVWTHPTLAHQLHAFWEKEKVDDATEDQGETSSSHMLAKHIFHGTRTMERVQNEDAQDVSLLCLCTG